ncbi:MAG: response regulator, partial [Rhodoferax sp.]
MKLFQAVKPTVLVVDDSPANLSLIAAILRDDYTVKAANHGEKALKLVSVDAPDLILLDIIMPDLDGYEVCRRLKSDSATQTIPVIFLTSKSDAEDEEMGLELGAVDY